MGLFDTIILPAPIKCKFCGEPIEDVQTKQFNPFMRVYYIGDLMESTVITGIFEEDVHCDNYQAHPNPLDFSQYIYLVIWHKILVGIEETSEKAHERIKDFGFGDLFLLYENLFVRQQAATHRATRIKNWVSSYLDYLRLSSEKQQELKTKKSPNLLDLHYHSILPYVDKENPFEAFLEDLEQEIKTTKGPYFDFLF